MPSAMDGNVCRVPSHCLEYTPEKPECEALRTEISATIDPQGCLTNSGMDHTDRDAKSAYTEKNLSVRVDTARYRQGLVISERGVEEIVDSKSFVDSADASVVGCVRNAGRL